MHLTKPTILKSSVLPLLKELAFKLLLVLMVFFVYASEANAGQLVRTSGGGDEISLLTSDLNDVNFAIEMGLHADDPCKCDLKLGLEKLLYLNNLESKVEKLLGSYSNTVNRQWQSVLQQAAQNAQAIEPGSTSSVAIQGVLNTLVAYGSQEFGAAATSHMSKTASNLTGAASGGIPGALQKVADAKTAKRMMNNIPALAGLDDLLSNSSRWKDLQNKIKKTKEKLWNALEGSPCIKALGKMCGGKGECHLSGLSSQSKKSATSLASMRSKVKSITRQANRDLSAKCCNLCGLFSALKKLEDLKSVTSDRIDEISKGVGQVLKTQISLNKDLFKWLSRKGALSGQSYQMLSAAMGFIPTTGAGIAITAAESVVNILDNMITQKAAASIKGNIKQVAKNLKELRQVLQDWKDHYDDLSKKQRDLIKNTLKNCSFKIPCDKPVTAIDRSEPEHEIGEKGESIIVDSGQWCSYWPWEQPGGVFTPDGETPKDPFTPDGWTPPEHGGPVFTPDGGIFFPEDSPGFIPEHVNTPEHKKHPKHTPEHTPVTYVKVKQSVIENGKTNSKPVAGAQFKFSSLAPDLPVAGNQKTDNGFDKDPVQGVSDKNGNITLGGKGANRSSQTEAPSFAGLFDTIGGIGEAVASPGRRGSRNTLQITIPSIKSYIIRIKVNRNKRNWQKPSSYLSKNAAKYIVRSWVAGDILYAVAAVPRHAGDDQ